MRATLSIILLLVLSGSRAIAAESLPLEDAEALYWLGVRFEHGEGVAQDYERARGFYCLASLRGNPQAAYSLGWMYANGRGLPFDDARAAGWFRWAASLGDEQASVALELIGEPESVADPTCPAKGDGWEKHKARIAALVETLAPDFGLDPEVVVALVEVESNYNPRALSPKGAQGLMQLMPGTAKRFGIHDAWDPIENLQGGMAYLSWLIELYGGDLVLTLAAYNAGEAAVERFGGVPPYSETRSYVSQITMAVNRETHVAGLGGWVYRAVFVPDRVREAYLRASSSLSKVCCQASAPPPS